MALPRNNVQGYMQSRYQAGEVLCKRAGIYGGCLNRRRRGTVYEVEEWIKYYLHKLAKGDYCPKRAAKIIARFEKALEHAKEIRSD